MRGTVLGPCAYGIVDRHTATDPHSQPTSPSTLNFCRDRKTPFNTSVRPTLQCGSSEIRSKLGQSSNLTTLSQHKLRGPYNRPHGPCLDSRSHMGYRQTNAVGRVNRFIDSFLDLSIGEGGKRVYHQPVSVTAAFLPLSSQVMEGDDIFF